MTGTFWGNALLPRIFTNTLRAFDALPDVNSSAVFTKLERIYFSADTRFFLIFAASFRWRFRLSHLPNAFTECMWVSVLVDTPPITLR